MKTVFFSLDIYIVLTDGFRRRNNLLCFDSVLDFSSESYRMDVERFSYHTRANQYIPR